MPELDYTGWPSDKDEPRKPFDRLMPFHRIRVPGNHFIKPLEPPKDPREILIRPRVISGDGYGVGARSTKDYDAKIGEDIGRQVGKLVETFLGLGIIKAVTRGMADFLRKVPILGTILQPLANAIDEFDPFVELFKFFGSRLDALLVDAFIRGIPAWVPTFDETLHPDIQVMELDGILVRSHQRYDSIAFWQWHRWYDWRFAVVPSPLFSEIVGFGNAHRDDDNTKLDEVRREGPSGEVQFKFISYHQEGRPIGSTVSAESVIDCEWDIGALGLPPGPFFDAPAHAKVDWCWPMTGMFFWAIGRSVYDCTHATANKGRRTKKADRKPQGQALPEAERLERGVHLNQLHPLKAIATARWEAFRFKENPKPVPAIQFMFFANNHQSSAGFAKKGEPAKAGFVALNNENYQFIVDLPPADLSVKDEYPVGHTPDFALNTLVLRPRLVVDPNFEPFASATGTPEDQDDREKNEITVAKGGPKPIVQLIVPKPGKPPQQALVTIPLKEMSAEINSYGVIVSIGWHDPDATQTKKVKQVSVTLVAFQVGGDTHEDLSDAEWVLNVGVNGRWFQFAFDVKRKGQRIEIKEVAKQPVVVAMLLSEDDFVMVSVNGMEQDPFGDLLELSPAFKPPKKKPAPKDPNSPVDSVVADVQKAFLADRILRFAKVVKIPTGPPDPRKGGAPPTTEINVPFIGDEAEWTKDIDTDDDHRASEVARAMFLRVAATNALDANDLLGMIDPHVRDPARKDPTKSVKRAADATDTPNPLAVKDIVKEVGVGKVKKCQLTAYASEVVGRMGTIAYQPDVLDYTFFYEVKVEDLPGEKK